jgi:hypothetical protein
MFKAIIVLGAFFSTATAFADQTPVKLRPSRAIHLKCINGTLYTDITGTSDDISLTRISGGEVRYEIQRDGYFLASCATVLVQEP